MLVDLYHVFQIGNVDRSDVIWYLMKCGVRNVFVLCLLSNLGISIPADDYPVALYPLTVCADVNDYSDYGNTGIEYDVDFTDFTNVVDGATVFKGSMTSYFEVPADDIFDTKFHLTILLHVQASGAGDLLYFSDDGIRLSLVDSAGNYDLQFSVEPRNGSVAPVEVTYANFPGDVWTYVAVVYDYNTAAATIYINSVAGTPVSFASSSEIKTLGNITVGRNMSGSIHCVRVYDRALDAAEIATAEMCPLGMYT